jgi:hypothetical protein
LRDLAGRLWLPYREGTPGSTPAKKALGVKLVRESTGRTVGFGPGFGRHMQSIEAPPCYLGFL